MILKPSMVISGKDCPQQASVEAVAEATIKCLLKNVPASVAGIAFPLRWSIDGKIVSSPQRHERYVWGAMSLASKPFPTLGQFSSLPWTTWSGDESRTAEAQARLLYRAQCNSAASLGEYSADMEKTLAAV